MRTYYYLLFSTFMQNCCIYLHLYVVTNGNQPCQSHGTYRAKPALWARCTIICSSIIYTSDCFISRRC